MGDACVTPLPTLAFDPLPQMSVWPQKPIFKGFYQKHYVFPENTMFSENRGKTRCFSQGTTFLQVLEALGNDISSTSPKLKSKKGGGNSALPSSLAIRNRQGFIQQYAPERNVAKTWS